MATKNNNSSSRYALAILLTVICSAVLFFIVYLLPVRQVDANDGETSEHSEINLSINKDSISNAAFTPEAEPPIVGNAPQETVNSESLEQNNPTPATLQNGKIVLSINQGLRGRRIVKYPELAGKFSEEGKIAVNVSVDESGNVSEAVIGTNGNTSNNTLLQNLAIEKAKEMRMNNGRNKQEGTILLNFILNK